MQTFKRLLVVALLPILLFTTFSSVFAEEQYVSDNSVRVDPLQEAKQRGNISVGEFTGAAIYNYPISLPPGRNGLTPSVSIIHNSQDNSLHNFVGYRWSLNEYSIKRLNKKGVEKLYNRNDFIVETPISFGELAELGGGFYAEKIESTFAKYEYKPDGSWLMTDKNGVKYSFGLSQNTKQFDPESPDHVYQWMLEEIRDTNDNFIRYTYNKVDNQMYPEKIIYTGHGQTDGIFEVRFLMDTAIREDTQFSYASGFLVETKHLINSIEVYADGKLRRKYDLSYTNIDPLLRKILAGIAETGYDLNNSPTSLPPTTFEYTPSVISWEETDLYPSPLDFASCQGEYGCTTNPKKFFWDITGDGLVDYPGYDAEQHIYANDGKGAFVKKSKVGYYVPGGEIPNVSGKFLDFNGDIKQNTISSYKMNGYPYNGQIFSSPGNAISVAMGSGEPFKPDNGASIADLNGDGLPDIIQKRHIPPEGNYDNEPDRSSEDTCLNENGNSCVLTDLWHSPLNIINDNIDWQYPRSTYVQDCNNDGLADVINDALHWINDGKGGWVQPSADQQCMYTSPDNIFRRQVDLNGDGLIDQVYSAKKIHYSFDEIVKEIKINTGRTGGWEIIMNNFPVLFGNDTGQNPDYVTDLSGIRVFDVNGDLLPDVIQSYTEHRQIGNQWYTYPEKHVWLHTGSRPYFLKTVHTSTGSQIDLEYKTSAQYFKEDGTQANPNLPIIIDTVSKITTHDGMGNSSSVSYLYEDGHYYYKNPYERGLAGFRVITKTDDLGYKTKTYYHQSENSVQDSANGEYADHISKKGRSYRTEVYDNQNQLVQISINRWDKNEISADHYYPFLTQSLTKTLSGTVKSTAQSFEYDAYGNVTQSIDYGEVQANGDDGSFTDIGNDLV
jgi:hypothetical protein